MAVFKLTIVLCCVAVGCSVSRQHRDASVSRQHRDAADIAGDGREDNDIDYGLDYGLDYRDINAIRESYANADDNLKTRNIGLVKPKQYDWKNSNMALFGSDIEKQIKKESAQAEPAWQTAGKHVGIQIWRIVKFKVEAWPKEDYGKFFDGDSYIILNTYKKGDNPKLQFDLHFWIGKHSTQDEYGTAAYKTVELDTFLDDKPVQHREEQGHESDLFKSYFDKITIMEGGAESGFRHVKVK